MSIAKRLRTLEEMLLTRSCPECGAGGSDDGEPIIRRVPFSEAYKPCPACGRVAEVIVMRPVRLGAPGEESDER